VRDDAFVADVATTPGAQAMNRFQIDGTGARRSGAVRSVLASIVVIALASLLLVQVDRDAPTAVLSDPAAAGVAPCSPADCLHVPAADPSVPAADRVFARRVLDDAIPPFPTF